MSILNNAVDSIILGVEDYQSPEPRRLLSATRNLVAGILLLYKHKLATLSPPDSDEALIKQRVVPVVNANDTVSWRGCGSKTVDVQHIRERCVSLGISVDWNRLERIVNARNDIEHYFPTLSQVALRSLIADTFLLISDFVRAHLNQDPLSLLGAATWNVLTKVAEVYEKEKADCAARIKTVDWHYTQLQDAILDWHCPNCGSGLIDVESTGVDRWQSSFQCRACGKQWDFERGAESAVAKFLASQNHHSYKDGGEPVTILCPNCSHETYDLEEDVCLLCEKSVERECRRCGMTIPAEEIDGGGLCSYCSYVMSKND